MSNLATLTLEEVEKIFTEYVDSTGFEWSWYDWDDISKSDPEVVHGLGNVYLEKHYGGEGQGDELWSVFRVEDGDTVRYFRIDGYYVSFDGGTYDGPFTEVEPQQRLVTFYE